MRQVCPTCDREVGNDNICPVCGLVKPIVVEFDAAQAQAQRQAGQRVAQGAGGGTAGAGNALASLVLLVIIMAGAWFGANHLFGEKSGGKVDKDQVRAILKPLHGALKAGDFATAAAQVDRLDQLAPGSRSSSNLRMVIALLMTEEPSGAELRGGFEACRWLQGRNSFALMSECGFEGKAQLEKKVLGLIETARTLADEGRFEKAREIFASIPEASSHHDQLDKEVIAVGNKVASKYAKLARRARESGDLAEAERQMKEAQSNASGTLRAELRKEVQEIRSARARRGRALYKAGKVAEAKAMLASVDDIDGITGLVERMDEVSALAERAQAMTASGKAKAARAAWEKILKLEPDSANHFHQLAKQGLAGQ